MKRTYVVALLLQFLVPSLCMYKRWVRSTNFGDPGNWKAGRAPCGNDVVLINEESPVIYIQTNTSLKELILPNNGELIFGQNAALSFTESPSPDCSAIGGDLEYDVSSPRKWLNTKNWCSADTETGGCAKPALLDSEKIPCSTDDTVFPREKFFYVDLGSGLNINIKSLKLSGKGYTTTTFNTYLQSDDGQRIFPPPTGTGATRSTVTMSRQQCNDQTGCACGNDQGKIFQSICSVVSNNCDRAMCKIPFRPMGSCCDMCGAMFTGNVSTGFRIADYRGILQKFITDNKDNGTLQLIVSKTGLGNIQAVITGDNGDTSIPIAKRIKADMDADAKTGGHKYRLDGLQLMESSGAIEPTPPSRHTGAGGVGGGGIAGIIIALIVLAAVAVFGLLFYRKKTGKSNNMIDDLMETPNRIRRSMPRGKRVPDDVRQRPGYEIEMDQGFGNPLYGDIGGMGGGDVKPMSLYPSEVQPTFDTSDPDGGFNNPLYDTVKKDPRFLGVGETTKSPISNDSDI